MKKERKWSKMARYPAMAAQDVAEMGGGGGDKRSFRRKGKPLRPRPSYNIEQLKLVLFCLSNARFNGYILRVYSFTCPWL